MRPENWREFLDRYTADLLECAEVTDGLLPEVLDSAWLGFPAATASEISDAEDRLGRRLPPSLRSFYSVTNGWRTTGFFVWNVLRVQELGWLKDREPQMFELAEMAEGTSGPFKNDPGDMRLIAYRYEQGTRVKRALVLNSEGDASTWLLDPDERTVDGEWAAGQWSSWNPAMEWRAPSFFELMIREHQSFLSLRET